MFPALLSAVFGLLGLACALVILVHAFRRSLGTGVMVLLIPAYIVVYAFSQFEHRRKGLLVAGLLSCSVLASVLYGVAAQGVLAARGPVHGPLPSEYMPEP